MNRTQRERVKSYILALLIIASLVQVGILWGYQNHGLPINFLLAFLTSSRSNVPNIDDVTRQEYFVPFRVIASNGNESHWAIGRNDASYNKLWDEAKTCLKEALASKQVPGNTENNWGEIVTKKGFVFEFKSEIKLDLLKWFLELSSASSDAPDSVHKMMVVPGFVGDITVYIFNGSGVFKYSMPAHTKKGETNIYDRVLAEIEQDENRSAEALNIIRDMYRRSKTLSSISPDILCAMTGSKYREYQSISFSVPDRISDLEQMAGAIFPGNEKDSYDRYVDINETLIFKNLDNIYRVYSRGFMEYKYLPGYGNSDKGSISAAFLKATSFIDRVSKRLNLKGDIYLSGIREYSYTYQFTFDYMVEDVPVYINLNAEGKMKEPVKNAITIEANSKRMLSCKWAIRSFEQGGTAGRFNIGIEEILNSSNLDRNEIYIRDMGVAYVVEAGAQKKLEPVWAIEKDDGQNRFVQLKKEQGE